MPRQASFLSPSKFQGHCKMFLKVLRCVLPRRDRNCNGGGVAISFFDDIPYNTRPDIDTGIESVSIQVNIPFVTPIIFNMCVQTTRQ